MTPEVATSWLDFINAGGTIVVLAAIIVYGAKMLPSFLARWGEHTSALVGLKTEIKADIELLRNEIKELRDDVKCNQKDTGTK